MRSIFIFLFFGEEFFLVVFLLVLVLRIFFFRFLKFFRILEGMNLLRDFLVMGFFGDFLLKFIVNVVYVFFLGILEGGGWIFFDVDFFGEDGFRRLFLEIDELEDMLYKFVEGVVVLLVGGG